MHDLGMPACLRNTSSDPCENWFSRMRSCHNAVDIVDMKLALVTYRLKDNKQKWRLTMASRKRAVP